MDQTQGNLVQTQGKLREFFCEKCVGTLFHVEGRQKYVWLPIIEIIITIYISRALNMADGNDKLLVMKAVAKMIKFCEIDRNGKITLGYGKFPAIAGVKFPI